MLRVINHQEMQIKITVGYHLTTVLNGCYQKGHEINVGEDMEKMYPSYATGGNVDCYSHYGKQYGGSSKKPKQNHHMIQ